MQLTDLYYIYDSVYSGENKNIFREIPRDMISNNDIAIICRYACEYYLRWTPETAICCLTKDVITRMKLDTFIKHLILPEDLSSAETRMYLYSLMYPELFKDVSKEAFVVEYYRAVLFGYIKKFPRLFLSGSLAGERNALICLMYALQVIGGCQTITECINLMSSKRKAVTFLKKVRLYTIMKRRYKDPIDYLKAAFVMEGMDRKWETKSENMADILQKCLSAEIRLSTYEQKTFHG